MGIQKLPHLFTFILVALFIVVGCDNSSDSGDIIEREVSVVMQVSTAQQPGPAAAIQEVDSLLEVKILIDELELESSIDDDSLDFEAEDLVVNLPLDGSEFELASDIVPEGTYDEFEMEIDNADDDANIDDPDLVEGPDDDQRHSVFVRGIYEGEEFTYRSQVEFEVNMDLNPPLIVSETGTSNTITISVDPHSWFMDAETGLTLNPSDPANRELIDSNIVESFEANIDDDDNGDDDNDDD